MAEASEAGKRVSWVELYLDLIFVLAVGRLAHVIVADPVASSVWVALGLFVVLWWTWIGFAVLYNRHGADGPRQRLLFLAGSVPTGVAAVAIEPASEGHSTAFAISLAATRLLLAGAQTLDGGWRDLLRRRITRAYAVSAVLFLVSIWVPSPWRYVLWGLAVSIESSALLTEDKRAVRRARRERDIQALRPANPAEALDPHHFAERFGLFLIILLGEVVISAGDVPVGGEGAAAAWIALVAAMILAAALWWLYFDAAADINLRVLELSGGSPTIARAIFATGHMVPAFALILLASGLALLLEGDPPQAAYRLACFGLGIYLAGTRVFLLAARSKLGAIVRVALLVATFLLARLSDVLSAEGYVVLLAAWAVLCAALASTALPTLDERGLPRKADDVVA